MKFYSEYGEDKWLAQRDLLPMRGVYVDIGCGHPERGSNTALLRELGWNGLAIDANNDYRQHWDALPLAPTHPSFVHAILASTPSVKFKYEDNSSMSRICVDGKELPAVPLEALLDAAEYNIGKIDLLSIDIEGAEFDVLQTLDIEKHQPGILIAEYATLQPDGGVAKDYRVFEHLMKNGSYLAVHQTVANIIYLRR